MLSLTRVTNYLARQFPLFIVALGLAFSLLIGLLDYVTGPELTLFVFYLTPVALVTWFAGRRAGWVVMFLAFTIWYFTSLEFKHAYSNQFLALWNVTVQLFYFALVVVLLSRLKLSHEHLRESESQLRFNSTRDGLTGLYNRSFFDEEMVRLQRSRQFPVSVIMADVDALKAINDNQGHAAGDEVIKRAARLLSQSFRTGDIVARVGGDEFVVLLPDTDVAAATTKLALVREGVAAQNGGEGLGLSLSLGVATAEAGESLAMAFQRADAQMYSAKRSRPVSHN